MKRFLLAYWYAEKFWKEKEPSISMRPGAPKKGLRKSPGTIFIAFFWNSQDPLQYVLLEAWQDFGALARHFETSHFQRLADERQSLTEGPPSVEVLLDF
jgi:antibiotic biosynthesis monooxygenase